MKRMLLLLTLLPLLAAAKVPDEEDIADKTMNPASPWYYPNLWLRYGAGDLTLTDEDYHYLYYGYAFRDEYKPLNANPDLDKLLLLASHIDMNRPLREDLESLVKAATAAADRDPFSPQILNTLAFAYGALGDTVRERANYEKMRHVIRTIEDSGDGLTQKTPRHILMFSHALDVLASREITHGRSRVVSRTVEYVPLTDPRIIDGRKVKGYYFDFSRIYQNKPEGYTYKRDRTWQFNNLKPRVYK